MKNWELTRSRILAAPVPENTESYTAIPHKVFLEEIEENLLTKGFRIQSEQFLAIKDYQVLNGRFILNNSNYDNSFLAPSIFFANSYNKQRKATIRGGAAVLVCKNGMVATTRNGSFTRKHSGNALEEFREHITLVIDGIEDEFKRLVKNMEEMKEIELTKATRAQLVGDMIINENLINTSQLAILKKEINFSEHFKENKLWDFYNQCTEALKDNHPLNYDNQHIKLHTYISDKFSLSGSRGLYGKGLEEAILLDETEEALAN